MLAKALRVHSTLISLVLQGKAELSPEHAEEANDFFSHTNAEAEFFSLLVQKGRAGTAKLRRRVESRLLAILRERDEVKERVKADRALSAEVQQTYYASILYSLHHMAAPLEGDPEKLSAAFACTVDRTKEILEFLVRAGLLQNKGGRYELGSLNLHLDPDAPLIRQHHTNFRLQSMQRLESRTDRDFFFSSALVLSRDDAKKIRANILSFLEQQADIVRPSASEEIYVLNLDYFRFELNR